MNRRHFLASTAIAAATLALSACDAVTSTTTNGVTTLTINVAQINAWGQAIVNGADILAPFAGTAGSIILLVAKTAEADLASVNTLSGGSATLTFNSTSIPAAVQSLLTDGKTVVADASGAISASAGTAATEALNALETIVSIFAATLGSMGAAAPKMSEAQALATLKVAAPAH